MQSLHFHALHLAVLCMFWVRGLWKPPLHRRRDEKVHRRMKHPLHRRREWKSIIPTRVIRGVLSWFTSAGLTENLHLGIILMLTPGATVLERSRNSCNISTKAYFQAFPLLETTTTWVDVTNSFVGVHARWRLRSLPVRHRHRGERRAHLMLHARSRPWQ